MIVVERAPLSADEEQMRREVLTILGAVHQVYEVETLDDFEDYLDRGLAELERAGFVPLLRRVVLIGDLGGAVCRAISDRLLPGASCRVLPQPTAWRELWRRREDLLAAAGRIG